jgi:hypothetical protein
MVTRTDCRLHLSKANSLLPHKRQKLQLIVAHTVISLLAPLERRKLRSKVKDLDALNRRSNNRVRARSRLLSFLKALQQRSKLARLRHNSHLVSRLSNKVKLRLNFDRLRN